MAHSLSIPPVFPHLGTKKPVMTASGWCHPDTGEILKFVSNGAAKAGAADVIQVDFLADSYERGDDLSVRVKYNEKVNVSVGSTLVVTASSGSNITLKAAAQTNVQDVVYNKQNGDGTTQEVVPDRADTYSIGSQTIGGTIVDNLGGVAAFGTLTVTDNPAADETVTIDSVVYTFKSTVSTTARQVKIGTTKEISMDNLAACINADSSAGSGVYGSSTVAHTTVTAIAVDATIIVTAVTKGTAGNSLATTETLANGSWGAATLASGAATSTSAKTVSAGVATNASTRSISAGVITDIVWDDDELEAGDPISVTVTYDQPVDVTAGAFIVVTSDTGDFNLYAAASQTNVTEVVFDKKVDNTTPQTVPVDVAATGTLTLAGNAANGETVTIASKVYTFKTAIINVSATGTLTLTGNAVNAETVTIGAKTYTFQTVLTNVDGNVLIGALATDSIDNLIAAITLGIGGGTLYAAATTAHPSATAAAGAGDTMTVTASTSGAGGNSIATTETMTNGSFGAATLTGGVTNNVDGNVKVGATASDSIDNLIAAINLAAGGGSTYAALMTAHPTVGAAAGAGDTMTLTADTAGVAGNSIASTETMGSGSFGAATLTGGDTNVPATLSIAAQTIDGTIVDHGNTAEDADLEITDELAATLEEIEIAA